MAVRIWMGVFIAVIVGVVLAHSGADKAVPDAPPPIEAFPQPETSPAEPTPPQRDTLAVMPAASQPVPIAGVAPLRGDLENALATLYAGTPEVERLQRFGARALNTTLAAEMDRQASDHAARALATWTRCLLGHEQAAQRPYGWADREFAKLGILHRNTPERHIAYRRFAESRDGTVFAADDVLTRDCSRLDQLSLDRLSLDARP